MTSQQFQLVGTVKSLFALLLDLCVGLHLYHKCVCSYMLSPFSNKSMAHLQVQAQALTPHHLHQRTIAQLTLAPALARHHQLPAAPQLTTQLLQARLTPQPY